MKRRTFMKLSGLAGSCLLIPTISLPVWAEESAELLDPASPNASALGYVEHSNMEGQHCGNCAQAKGADLNAPHIGCNIFPGKQVMSSGWCKVWSPRPS